jgi:hypothetical protein
LILFQPEFTSGGIEVLIGIPVRLKIVDGRLDILFFHEDSNCAIRIVGHHEELGGTVIDEEAGTLALHGPKLSRIHDEATEDAINVQPYRLEGPPQG